MNSRLAACGASTLVASSVMPARLVGVSGAGCVREELVPHHAVGRDDEQAENGRRAGGPRRALRQPLQEGQANRDGAARKNARRLTAAGRAKGGRAGEPPSGEERW
jgi:hypothetical protein